MNPSDDLAAEYHERGVLLQTFELDDPSVVSSLCRDATGFRSAVEANRLAGRSCVPYGLTDAIVDVAHDATIDRVVRTILGEHERWVMWGANIQEGTPNDAGAWHVDLESRLWPTITIAVGLAGCSDDNSTRYIPCSQHLLEAPSLLTDQFDDNEALRITSRADRRCREIVSPQHFAAGRFYVFDARGWHSGEKATATERTMLFLHYHRARDRRIPLMLDYRTKHWSTEAAPYIAGPDHEPHQPVNLDRYRPPSPARERLDRLRRKLTRH